MRRVTNNMLSKEIPVWMKSYPEELTILDSNINTLASWRLHLDYPESMENTMLFNLITAEMCNKLVIDCDELLPYCGPLSVRKMLLVMPYLVPSVELNECVRRAVSVKKPLNVSVLNEVCGIVIRHNKLSDGLLAKVLKTVNKDYGNTVARALMFPFFGLITSPSLTEWENIVEDAFK